METGSDQTPPAAGQGAGRALGQGSRLTAAPSVIASATAYQHELDGVDHLFGHMDLADMAHLLELVDVGLVGPGTAQRLADGLATMQREGPAAIEWDPVAGDIYNNRTGRLRVLAGDAVDALHTGRARRECTTLAWHLAARRAVLELGDALLELVGAIADAARREITTIAPDFTYLQRAQPTTLGHYLSGFAWPLVRDLDRTRTAFLRVDASPAGGGSVNGSMLPLDRERMAQRLGFSSVLAHTRDAMWQSDLAAELAGLATSPAVNVSRLAEDLFVWSTVEFGYFESADEHCRNSVIMPQKKNPYALAYLRGLARATLGHANAVVATQLGVTGQPDARTTAYVEVPRSLAQTTGGVQLMTEILERGTFHRERLAAAAGGGHSYATDYCDLLTLRHGVPNRRAHKVVGRAIREAIESGRDFIADADLAVAEAELGVELPRLSDDDLARLRDPMAIAASRATLGGAGEAAMEDQLDQLARVLADHDAWLGAARARIDAAEQGVTDAAATLGRP